MAEALNQVKRQLGRDAVILHTRTFTRGGLLGWRARTLIEVTAARQMSDLPILNRSGRVPAKPADGLADSGGMASRLQPGSHAATQTCLPASRESMPPESNGARTLVPASTAITEPRSPALECEVRALKSLVQDLVVETRRTRLTGLPEELLPVYLNLIEAQVAEELARELVERIRAEIGPQGVCEPLLVREKLAAYIESMLPVCGPIRLDSSAAGVPTLIALVGPTGVGKTTTIAKLAANLSLRENRRVGLITIDTYRIAAVDQLRTYAQIIDVPLEVVMTPAQMRAALDRLRGCDVILIDTAGRSQNDAIRINELRCYLDQARPHEIHLVLSSTSSPAVLHQAIERFSEIGVDRLIFTKLDEAIGFGVILSCLARAKLGLSYVTTGQDVPDDIEVGRSRRLAELIVQGGAERDCGDRACSS
jgi:flagellar biosynthesis protein FlhF